MRIVQVIPYFSPVFGGEVNFCYNLSRHMVNRGHEVTILTSDYLYDEEYAHQLKGVEVIPFRTYAQIGRITYTPTIRKWIREYACKKDVFHLHSFRTYQNIVMVNELVKMRKPYLMEAHGSLPIMGKEYSKKAYDYLWGQKLLFTASNCIALNNLEKIQYLSFGLEPRMVEIIPNGIDLEKYLPQPERGEFREAYGIEGMIRKSYFFSED